MIVSFNGRYIHIYDSLRGGELHDLSVEMRSRNMHNSFPCIYLSLVFRGRRALTYLHTQNTSSTMNLTLLKWFMSLIYQNKIKEAFLLLFLFKLLLLMLYWPYKLICFTFSFCGLYFVAYAYHISNENVVPKFDSDFTRIQYAFYCASMECKRSKLRPLVTVRHQKGQSRFRGISIAVKGS